MSGDPGSSGASRQGEDSTAARHQEHLARAFRGYHGDRALSRAQWHGDPEILPQRLKGGTAPALYRPARAAVEELEVLDGRRHRARALEPVPGRLSGHRQEYL